MSNSRLLSATHLKKNKESKPMKYSMPNQNALQLASHIDYDKAYAQSSQNVS